MVKESPAVEGAPGQGQVAAGQLQHAVGGRAARGPGGAAVHGIGVGDGPGQGGVGVDAHLHVAGEVALGRGGDAGRAVGGDGHGIVVVAQVAGRGPDEEA